MAKVISKLGSSVRFVCGVTLRHGENDVTDAQLKALLADERFKDWARVGFLISDDGPKVIAKPVTPAPAKAAPDVAQSLKKTLSTASQSAPAKPASTPSAAKPPGEPTQEAGGAPGEAKPSGASISDPHADLIAAFEKMDDATRAATIPTLSDEDRAAVEAHFAPPDATNAAPEAQKGGK